MKYQCAVVIDAAIEKVMASFLEIMIMSRTLAPGSETVFSYNLGDREVVMKETIESCDLPGELVVIYEIDGVWNRCVNRFTEEDGKVVFTIESEFVFADDPPVNEENFRNKTQKQMEDFKALVEGNL